MVRRPKLVATALLFTFILCLFISPVWPQQHEMSSMKAMPGMDHGAMTMSGAQESAESEAERLAGVRVSELNHHLAGFILILAGIFVIAEESLAKHWSPARYVWPTCFLAAGLFVLVFSDTEIWPLGPQSPWYVLTHSLEALQHKTFAAILIALGYVEFQRARGRFNGVWSASFFPVVSIVGAILLLFHVHGVDMGTPDAMQVMGRIQNQHRWFAAVGVGIAATKGLAEVSQDWQQILKRTWPALLTVLGILLMTYTE